MDYVYLLKSIVTIEQSVIKLNLSKPPSTGMESYQYMKQSWKQERMSPFLLRLFNDKNVVSTLDAMQKLITFYHHKDIDLLKLGCTVPNLASIRLHKSTEVTFSPSTKREKDLLEEIPDVVGCPPIVFTCKSVVDDTFIRKSTNICKSIVVIDASQPYHYSTCQLLTMSLYTRWDLNPETCIFTPHQKRPVVLKILSCPVFKEEDRRVKLIASTLQANRRKLTVTALMDFVLIATVFSKH